MRATPAMSRRLRRLLSAAALLPLLAWAVWPAAAAAPLLCEPAAEREPAHACCPPGAGHSGMHGQPGQPARVHEDAATHAADEPELVADCSCHPAPDANGAEDSRPAASLDAPSPRIGFPAAALGVSRIAAGAGAPQRAHVPPDNFSPGSGAIPLFLLNEILLI